MKKLIHSCLTFCLFASLSFSQTYPFYDNFESYSAFHTPPGYTGSMQVYLVHGTSSSQGLIAQMTSLGPVRDSSVSPWIGPLTANSNLSFDWRIVQTALYPALTVTMVPNDEFDVLVSPDGSFWSNVLTVNQSNFTPTTSFAHVVIPMAGFSGSNVLVKFQMNRGNISDAYFLDIDNISLSDTTGSTGISEPYLQKTFALFPNPVSDKMTVIWPAVSSGTIQLSLNNILGREVLHRQYTSGRSATLDISFLSNGIYYMNITAGNVQKTLRFRKE